VKKEIFTNSVDSKSFVSSKYSFFYNCSHFTTVNYGSFCFNGDALFANIMLDGIHVSQVKTSAVYYLRKTYNVNKIGQVKPGKGAGIW
jgi:hypothetical protein